MKIYAHKRALRPLHPSYHRRPLCVSSKWCQRNWISHKCTLHQSPKPFGMNSSGREINRDEPSCFGVCCWTHPEQRIINSASKAHVLPCDSHNMLGNESVRPHDTFADIPHYSFTHFNAKSIRTSHQITFHSVNTIGIKYELKNYLGVEMCRGSNDNGKMLDKQMTWSKKFIKFGEYFLFYSSASMRRVYRISDEYHGVIL